MALMGVGNAFMWGPLGATATRNLPLSSAGAGSGVYNTTRQVGAVLGSAAIAAVIQARLGADLPGIPSDLGGMQASGTSMPAQVADGFAVGDVGVHAAPGRGARRRRRRGPLLRASGQPPALTSSGPARRHEAALAGGTWTRRGATRPRPPGRAAEVDDHPLGDHPGVGLQHVQGHAGEVLLPVDEG